VRRITNPETGEKDLYVEPGLVTLGDDVNECARLLKQNQEGYTASDVVDYLLSDWEEHQRQVKKERAREEYVNPVRWGYSATEVANCLLLEELEKQTQEDRALVMV